MRKAVRAIVIKDGQLLVIHRNKFGTEYYTLPGGGVEQDESLEEAVVRELYEETMVKVDVTLKKVFVEHTDNVFGDQHVYLCEYIEGEPRLMPGGEEDVINELGENLYEPMWIPIDKLPEITFLSDKLQQRIIAANRDGWPEEPIEFSSTRNV